MLGKNSAFSNNIPVTLDSSIPSFPSKSGNRSAYQDTQIIQDPGISQMCEARNIVPQNSTTDMLAELAEKLNTMKKLQSMIKDFFALDQKCCIEFLEKITKELKKENDIKPSANLNATSEGFTNQIVQIENESFVYESFSKQASRDVENQNFTAGQRSNTVTEIEDSIEPFRETVSSAEQNVLFNENQLSVDGNIQEKIWSLANRISDKVTQALELEGKQERKKQFPYSSRKCYRCRRPGHQAIECREPSPNRSFHDDRYVEESRNDRFEERPFNNSPEFDYNRFRSGSVSDGISEISEDFSPARKKLKPQFNKIKLPRVCYICRLPGHVAAQCRKNETGPKQHRRSQSHSSNGNVFRR